MNTAIKLVCVLLGAFLLQACQEDKLTPIGPSAIILAYGDSLTYGKGVKEEDAYPSVLQKLSGRVVVNEGVSGEVTQDGLARLPEVMADIRPDIMILLEGGNDILRNHNLKKTKKNLAKMIELAQSEGIQVVLVGVPEKKLFSNSASIFPELAEEYQLVFEGELVASLLRSPKYKSDSVHFNELGYRKMAQSIFELLRDHGAL